MLTPSPCGDLWRARAILDALSFAQNSTFRRAQSSVRDAPQAHLRASFPPRRARDARPPAPHDSPAATPALFFQFLDNGGGTHMEHACRIANAAAVHRHGDDLLFDCG